MATTIDLEGSNRWRVIVRVEGASKPVHVSPWMTRKQAEHAERNHKAMVKDRGWTHRVTIEEYQAPSVPLCPGCNLPAHATESDDRGYHAECQPCEACGTERATVTMRERAPGAIDCRVCAPCARRAVAIDDEIDTWGLA